MSTLILVPILAAIWPRIRLAVNQYNSLLDRNHSAFLIAADRLKLQASQLSNENSGTGLPSTQRLQRTLEQTSEFVDRQSAELSKPTLSKRYLPLVWGFAFFAALSAFLPQCWCLICGPSIVRSSTPMEYADSEVTRWQLAPWPGHASSAPKWADEAVSRKLLVAVENFEYINENFSPVTLKRPTVTGMLAGKSLVYRGAEAEWHVTATEREVRMWFAMAFYGVAVLMILVIIALQTAIVLKAAGM